VSTSTDRLTTVLSLASAGDAAAASELLPLVYEELRDLARFRMRNLPPGQTIQPTALVHEAYMRLCRAGDPSFAGRAHFFRAAARAMRDIVAERARARSSIKRGGRGRRVDLDGVVPSFDSPCEEVMALDEALGRLEATDSAAAEVVTLRFFGGLKEESVAEVLGVSTRTVERHWRYARAWLHQQLSGEDEPADEP
jgi:RNA polymerase sigma factor (TIGR02999 family)